MIALHIDNNRRKTACIRLKVKYVTVKSVKKGGIWKRQRERKWRKNGKKRVKKIFLKNFKKTLAFF